MVMDRYLGYGISLSALLHSLILLSFCENSMESASERQDPPYIEVQLGDFSSFHSQDALADLPTAARIMVPQQLLPQLPQHQLNQLKNTAYPQDHNSDSPPRPDNLATNQENPQLASLTVSKHSRRQDDLTKAKIKAQALAQLKRNQAVMKHEEFIKRLVTEKARKNQQYAKVMTSPPAKSNQLLRRVDGNAQGSGERDEELKLFLQQLHTTISSAYQLPEVYQYRSQLRKTAVNIQLDTQGAIVQLSLQHSSGDPVFDALSLAVIRAAQPLPRPPRSYAGQVIVVHFSPFEQLITQSTTE